MSRKSSKNARRPAWINTDILAKVKHKKQAYRKWKYGQVTWENHTGTIQAHRHRVRKAKAKIESSLARDVKETASLSTYVTKEQQGKCGPAAE